MPLEKAARTSLEGPKSSTRQWLQGAFVGIGLLAIGNWTASRYASGWTSNNVLDYVKSSIDGQNTESYGSTLTEPWSKVSHLVSPLVTESVISAH